MPAIGEKNKQVVVEIQPILSHEKVKLPISLVK